VPERSSVQTAREEMRLDKFLKVSRIIKRRTLAQEICLGGRVKKNGRTAKPSTTVGAGDVIEIAFGARTLTVRVLKVAASADKKSAGEMYETISGTGEGENDNRA
jgi:ribosomal 50S subunit-recycling heat shock protein